MNITREDFSSFIKGFNFESLFNYLGWDRSYVTIPKLEINGTTYSFKTAAQKSAFMIIVCTSSEGVIPPYSMRSRIDSEMKKRVHEHMLIFCDNKNREQVWLYSYYVNGKPRKAEIKYNTSQDPERLYQRAAGLIFSIDEQDKITIFDVTQRMNANFAVNTQRVTKKFYDGFRKQHSSFMKLMDGLSDTLDKEWYASIMLNRLMFCYFMQKRGFLNNDRNYLRNKLNECRQSYGKDKFYSFYRNFLLILFHKGFSDPDRSEDITQMIGKIPYLNGGLFDVHKIEKKYPEININDSAFESVFDLFDEYEWYLDTRDCSSGNEISPDVLGFIFEKYINDRAQMGAYYTQEDITEYIGRNAIIPYLFNSVKDKNAEIFRPESEMWTMLRDSGDKYIFSAMKKGVKLQLPDYIEIGIDTKSPDLLKRRERWNETAPEEYALPTEIWREVVDRRQRYEEIVRKIMSGEIKTIQDFITYNLDICAFAQDVVETIDDPGFINDFYNVLSHITVLDPTCGSGAFLFIALNILEPLYDSCLNRMEDYLENNSALTKSEKHNFEKTIESKDRHQNKQYFIIKSIILNNLYGVDIMNEAVETAKLRLFLKLVSTATPNYQDNNIGIEPLPDIDFNIKCGNSLIGYATEREAEKDLIENVGVLTLKDEVLEKIKQLSMATIRFKEKQLEESDDTESFKKSKDQLSERQHEVEIILNKVLYDSRSVPDAYDKWLKKSQPFHWVSEFYSIISAKDGNGGFDVIIGNPPYVEYSSLRESYDVSGYDTKEAGNLYAYVLERSKALLQSSGFTSMIVPISGHSTSRMQSLVLKYYDKYNGRYTMNLSADAHPSCLFDGVRFRLSIFIVSNALTGFFSSKYKKWYASERENLFSTIEYNSCVSSSYNDVIVKVPSRLFVDIFSKVHNDDYFFLVERGPYVCYYHNVPINWIRSHTFTPYFCSEREGVGVSTQLKKLNFSSDHSMRIGSSILNSSLFFLWWIAQSDCYHLNKPEIDYFRFTVRNDSIEESIIRISQELSDDMQQKSLRRVYHYRSTGRVEYDEFYMKKSKSIIDKIDKALAQHYGFSDEELDYIINYDIKYRLGSDSETDE